MFVHTLGKKRTIAMSVHSDLPKKVRLDNHILDNHTQHTADRPHKCTTCEKTFVTKYTLMEHVRTHTGGKTLSLH